MRVITKATTLVALVVWGLAAEVGIAGEEELDDMDNAKLAHHRAKQRMLDSRKSSEERDRDSRQNSGSCGSLNIGNVSNQRGARGPKEVTVIVTGDVINANNNCR